MYLSLLIRNCSTGFDRATVKKNLPILFSTYVITIN